MQVIIVGHHSRMAWVQQLQDSLDGAIHVIDFADHGAAAGHRKALEIAALSRERCIIMEDDAIPVMGFHELARQWCNWYPDDLLSFYLGTARPTGWQARVDIAVAKAVGSVIRLPQLLHGVCYTPPALAVPNILERMGRRAEADFAIGSAWGRGVLYPVESLVEHRDGPTVEKHWDGQPRTEARVARKLAAPLMYDR